MKHNISPRRNSLSLPVLLMAAASTSWTLIQAADLSYNTGSTLSLTGAASYDNVRVGVTGGSVATIVNATGTTSFTSNGSTIYVGTNLGSTTSVGRLDLGPLNSLTASTKIVIGGNEPDSDNASNHSGTVTTATGSVTTIATPLMVLGTSKGTGAFTLGSNATLNLGSTSARTGLIISRSDTGNGYNRPANGSMNLSGGTANLNLSSLVIGRKTVGGNSNSTYTGAGTLTLSSSVQNRINISGAGEVVRIGYSTIDLMGPQGTLTIGNLHSDSSITSTDNSTAILLGYQAGAAGNPITTGTLNLNGGSLTITTTGAAIAGGGGGGISNLNLNGATLKAGASSNNWIQNLTNARIRANGVTFDTNGYDITIPQVFVQDGLSPGGGLTKAGAGTLTLSSVNSYTGPTNVTGGTLVIDGTNTATTGNLSVSEGSRLGGNGATPAAVTLATGGKWLVGISDWTGDAGTGFTDLTVGSLVLDGAWTLDVTSLTAYANFSDATKTFPILTATGGITGFNAGNVTVTAHDSFAGTGSWSVQKTNNTLELVYTATPPPADDYAVWDGEYPDADLSDKAADNDGDGLSNFQEYAFGLDPTSGASVNPIIDISMLKTTGVFSYSRRAGTDLTFTVLTSDDLQNWISVADPAEQPGPVVDGVQIIEVDLTGMEFTDPFFIRVKAE